MKRQVLNTLFTLVILLLSTISNTSSVSNLNQSKLKNKNVSQTNFIQLKHAKDLFKLHILAEIKEKNVKKTITKKEQDDTISNLNEMHSDALLSLKSSTLNKKAAASSKAENTSETKSRVTSTTNQISEISNQVPTTNNPPTSTNQNSGTSGQTTTTKPEPNYFQASVIGCNVNNCSPLNGVCVSPTICKCQKGKANFNPTGLNPTSCSYDQKKQLTGFLLEFFLDMGAGHFYRGLWWLGLIKLCVVLIFPILFCSLAALVLFRLSHL